MLLYKPNEEKVISKIIDDEAVIIKLGEGTYYNLNEVGTLIWKKIQEKSSESMILESVLACFTVEKTEAAEDLKQLLQKLNAENLVSAFEEISDSSPVSAKENKASYSAPGIEVYSDMEDLLALDPPVPGMNDITWKK